MSVSTGHPVSVPGQAFTRAVLRRAALALVTLAVLLAGVARTSESQAAIPEPTAIAQAGLAQACATFGPLRAPMSEPLRVVCAAAVLVYTDLLTQALRNRMFLP